MDININDTCIADANLNVDDNENLNVVDDENTPADCCMEKYLKTPVMR